MMPTRKHIFPVVMVAVVLSVLGAAPRAAERVALVIGNAAYEHTTALRNPRNDAADMARVLGVEPTLMSPAAKFVRLCCKPDEGAK